MNKGNLASLVLQPRVLAKKVISPASSSPNPDIMLREYHKRLGKTFNGGSLSFYDVKMFLLTNQSAFGMDNYARLYTQPESVILEVMNDVRDIMVHDSRFKDYFSKDEYVHIPEKFRHFIIE